MSTLVVGLDIECYDPLLNTSGYSWKFKKGYILNTALYYESNDEVKVIAGIHNDNCPYEHLARASMNGEISALLKNPDALIVGANLMYDIGWLLYEYKMTVYDVKCRFFDVLSAEACINEFAKIDLDTVSKKYLRYGKTKARIEEWVFENIKGARGDFRKYLKDAPYDLLCEYVEGDARNPVKIMRKQLTILKEQELTERVKLDFDCILPILQITINGFPIDVEKKKANLETLTKYRDMFKAEFTKEYKVNLNVNSSKQVASFLDRHSIPYKVKITLKGYDNQPFVDYEDTDRAYARAKKLVSSFRYVKRVPVAFIPCTLAERTEELLKENGFMLTSSPNIDKKFFASAREQYEVVGLIADWKQANGIISKILGDKYNQFIALDEDGVSRVHSQYHITKSEGSGTISSRLSSSQSNAQQIPSKGGLTLKDGTVVSFPDLTRSLFTCEKGGVYFKIDYSQIEYRLIVNYAVGEGAEEARQLFIKDPHTDFHQYTVDLTGLSRKLAKNMSFGVSFGMGLKSMAENFGWTMEHAESISQQYHEHIPFVAPTLALVGDTAKERGYIRTVLGNKARLRNENLAYTMLNRLTQGSGADILKASIVRAYKEGVWKDLKVHVTVHDELGGTCYPTLEQVKRVIQLEDIMENTVKIKIPLLAEAEFGMNWQDVKSPSEWLEVKEKEPEKWNRLPKELKFVVNTYTKLKGAKNATSKKAG